MDGLHTIAPDGYLGVPMTERKRVALIAHDNCKLDLCLPVTRFLSGPLGGDQQIGAGIVEGRIDFVIFFWDPLEPHPHDVDVKALLRIAVVYNVPIACNRSTADFLLSSPLMGRHYERRVGGGGRGSEALLTRA